MAGTLLLRGARGGAAREAAPDVAMSGVTAGEYKRAMRRALHGEGRQVVLERSLRECLGDGLGGGSSLCVRLRGVRKRVNALARTKSGVANTAKPSAVFFVRA